MKKQIVSILLICVIIFGTVYVGFCEGKNLSKKEVEKMIEDVATKRGIPSVIMKSIAKIESSCAQFDKNGNPVISKGGHIGIMQVSKDSGYNLEKLKNDPVYNIEAGADLLLGKWRMANRSMGKIGDMDPNILEHWYFALWGYNGLLDRNNPNIGNRTYQDRIYEIALKDYGQKITPINKKPIPSRGWPIRNKKMVKVETPKEYHEGDIIKYSPNDKVKLEWKDFLILHDKPNGKEIGRVKQNDILTIIEGPILNGGFYFYKVNIDEDNRTGWIFGNWISKIE